MRRAVLGSAALAAALTVSACGGGSGSSGDDVLVIGGHGPLTGPVAGYGVANQRGAELALEDITKRGNLAFDLKLVFEDDACNAAEANSAYQRLVHRTEVDLLFGGACSPSALVVAESAENEKVPYLNTSATSPAIATPPRTHVFSTQVSALDEATSLVDMTIEQFKPSKVGFAFTANDYGVGAVKSAKDALSKRAPDVEVAVESGFPQGTSDFSGGLLRVKNADPDILFVVGSGADLGTMLKQARDIGVTAEFVGFSSIFTVDTMRTAGDLLAGVTGFFYTPSKPAANSPNAELAGVFQRFHAKYGEWPDGLALQGYTGMLVLEHALSGFDKVPTRAELVTALESVKEFDSNIYKPITFGPGDRAGVDSGVLMRLENGRDEEQSLWGNFTIITD